MVKVHFHGAARTVTGSKHLVEFPDGRKILLDCGLYQGRRKDTYERNWNFPFDPTSVDALILSHAHIDHSGNIPNLMKNGFKGPVYCTHATQDLCSIMLRDSGHIQEKDTEWLNKRNKRKGEPLVEPLYTVADAERCLEKFVGHHYFEAIDVFGDGAVRCTFYEAGHILGSAMVGLDIKMNSRSEEDSTLRLLFSGDIGRNNLPVIRDPDIPGKVDVIIMETTYGDRLHNPIKDSEAKLKALIERVIDRRGKIIIPSFSVGRTQEIIHVLHQMWLREELPRIPVYIDSPLAVNATEIFRRHPECFDKETRELILESESMDAFGFQTLTYIHDVEESKRLNTSEEPCMIISASGMCEAGRILHHLRNNIDDPRNCVLIAGFQAQHTLGRRIVEREPEVRIFGEKIPLKAEVVVMNEFSAHADKNELIAWLDGVKERSPDLKRIYLVHGEESQSLAFSDTLVDRYPDLAINVPVEGQISDIG